MKRRPIVAAARGRCALQLASYRRRVSLAMQAVKRFAAGRWSAASFSTHDKVDPAPLHRVEMPLQKPAEVLRDEYGANVAI